MTHPAPAPAPGAVNSPATGPERPERPAGRAVAWSVVINLLSTLLAGGAAAAVAALLLSWGNRAAPDEFWAQMYPTALSTRVLVVLVAVAVGAVVLASLLTVGALLLLRLSSQYRTLPAFVQALLAWLVMLVLAGVVLPVLGSLGQVLWLPFLGLGA